MTYGTGDICNFRDIGSHGLVVFERDGTLLKTKRPSEDLALSDLNHPLICVLSRFRSRGIRYGFFSDDRGMDAGRRGRVAASALVTLIDAILRADNAEPDFWMAVPISKLTRGENAQKVRQHSNSASMLRRAIDWYGIEKQKVVLVCSSPVFTHAANALGVSTIHYSASSLSRDEGGAADLPETQRVENFVKLSLGSTANICDTPIC